MAPGVACCMSAWRTCVYDFFGLLFAVFVLGNVFCPPPQQQEVERIRGCDCQEHPFRKELKTAARDFTVTDPLTLLWLLHVVTVHLAPYRPGTIGVWECVCFQENFSTPAMAHLQNPPPPPFPWPLPPTHKQALSALLPCLVLADHCVFYWHAFCLQGLLTKPQDHLE